MESSLHNILLGLNSSHQISRGGQCDETPISVVGNDNQFGLYWHSIHADTKAPGGCELVCSDPFIDPNDGHCYIVCCPADDRCGRPCELRKCLD